MPEQSETKLFRRFPFLGGQGTVLEYFAKIHLWILAGYPLWAPIAYLLGGWPAVLQLITQGPMIFGVFWLIAWLDYLLRWETRREVSARIKVVWDEREEAVFYKALAWGFGASWVALVLAVGWFIQRYSARGPEGVTMVSLSVILGACFNLLVLFFSLSVLVQKRGEQEAKDE